MLVTPDSFFVYNRLNRTLYTGATVDLPQILPLPASYQTFLETLTGTLHPDPDRPWILGTDSLFYHVIAEDASEEYYIHPGLWRTIIHLQRNPSEKTILFQQTLARFHRVDSLLIPFSIQWSYPATQTALRLNYQQFSLEPPSIPSAIKLPDHVQRINIKQ